MARSYAFVYVNIDQVDMTHTQKHTVDVQNSEFHVQNSELLTNECLMENRIHWKLKRPSPAFAGGA